MLMHVGQVQMECTFKVKNRRKTSASLLFFNGDFGVGKNCYPLPKT